MPYAVPVTLATWLMLTVDCWDRDDKMKPHTEPWNQIVKTFELGDLLEAWEREQLEIPWWRCTICPRTVPAAWSARPCRLPTFLTRGFL